MTDAPHPFHQWVDAARPRQQLWRTVLGLVLIALVYLVWLVALLLIALGGGLLNGAMIDALRGDPFAQLTYVENVVFLLVTLATFWGVWFGVWAAVKWVNKRALETVFAHSGRVSLRQFAIGGAIAAGYVAISIVLSFITGQPPHASGVDLGSWAIALAPIVIFLFFQVTAEELVFRGYLPQQLAARFPSPLVWGLLPSLLFGIMHISNGGSDLRFAASLVVNATLAGMVMMAMVWRTGSLAAGMGFHLVNNVAAIVVTGPDVAPGSLALFVWSPEQMVSNTPLDVLTMGLLLSFVLSPLAPLPKGQPLARRKETRAAP